MVYEKLVLDRLEFTNIRKLRELKKITKLEVKCFTIVMILLTMNAICKYITLRIAKEYREVKNCNHNLFILQFVECFDIVIFVYILYR